MGSAHTSAHTPPMTLSGPAAAEGREKFKPQAPSLPPQHPSHTPAAVPEAASAPSATSPHRVIAPVPNSPLTPGLGLPTLPLGHPHLAAMQAPWASLLACGDPWLSTSTLAAASAVAMPRPPHCRAPAYPHCSTCTCLPNSAAAGNRVGPQHGVC